MGFAITLGAVLLTMTVLAAPVGARELIFPPGQDPRFDWASFEAMAANSARNDAIRDQRIVVSGPWVAVDKALFESVVAYFEAATDVNVDYIGTDSFEQQVMIDIAAGTPPDVAIFPQPGLAAELAREGKIRPLPGDTAEWIRTHYAAGGSWARYGNYPGPDGVPRQYAFPYKTELKSLVWYVPENFRAAGYDVPATMEDLKALTERIARQGATPWCIGIGSGGATGWPATDWVEEMMLRLYPAQDYDDWVANRLKFDDPKVMAAIDEFGWFARNPAFVAGGTEAVATTDFRDSVQGLFTNPPQCFMHHQASFISSFFPPDYEIGRDVDFFHLPRYAARSDRSVLTAGTMFAVLTDAPAAQAFVDYLRTPLAHEIWMAQVGFLSPHRNANPDVYQSDAQRRMARILLDATVARFDGSDLMPAAIGVGAFWKGMVDYTSGRSVEEVTREIQQVWDGLDRGE